MSNEHKIEPDSQHLRKEQKQIEFLMQFSASTNNYCVCIVDIVGSTNLMMTLHHSKISRYYEIFLNRMAEIVREYGGMVVKNIGDSLLFYFPGTESGHLGEFENVLGCCFAMIDANSEMNRTMRSEDLPPITYRISCEYGPVVVAKTSTSSTNDIFGNTVNICSKINRLAEPNTVVVGSGFYEKVKVSGSHSFTEVRNLPFKIDQYKVYSVRRNL